MSDTTRWFAGLAVSADLRWAEAAVVQIHGRGEELQLAQWATRADALPAGPRPGSRVWPTGMELAQFRELANVWTQHLLRLLRQAMDEIGASWHEVICVGLLEPWWVWASLSEGGFGFAWPLAPWLAEFTGWSVAHGFAWRDVAAGGHTRDVTAAADWLLFRSEQEPRLVIHLGEEVLLHYLTPCANWLTIRGVTVMPSLAALDRLTAMLMGRPDASDRSGHLAVQGRLIPDLLARWSVHPSLLSQQLRPPTPLLLDTSWARATCDLAEQRRWQPLDVLCTTCHWLAQNLAGAFAHLQLSDKTVRIIVSGLGCRNGFLWQLLQDKLRPNPIHRSDDFGVTAEACQAVRAALLAALLLDQVPASVPQASGCSGVRLLGQWTPGSLSNWSRCLHWMTTGRELAIWEEG